MSCCRDCNELKAGLAAWSFLARRPELRANFLEAVRTGDVQYARPVWDRLLRAIHEAAAAGQETRSSS